MQQPRIKHTHPDSEYYFKEGCHILEILNDPGDPDVSIARARVEPGVTTRLHKLTGITERYFILQGSGTVEVDGSLRQTVTEGDVVIIPAGCSQRISNTTAGRLIFLAVCTPRFIPAAYVDLE